MIGRLRGRLDYRASDHVLIDVGGVGYIVYCSERTMSALPGTGEAVSLFTDLMVREDLLQLFGFSTLVEKEWHRLLMSVQGVGAKVSLAILGALGPEGVGRAIALGDWNAMKAARGVGLKTAQRIVLDLKDKAPGVMAMAGQMGGALQAEVEVLDAGDTPSGTGATARARVSPPARSSGAAQADALSALANLGYSPGEAVAAVAQAAGDNPEAGEAILIRAALKLLAPKS